MLLHKIDNLIKLCLEEQHKPDSSQYLPEVIQWLEVMKSTVTSGTYDKIQRTRMAGRLFRIVTDSYSFESSELGQKLVDFCNDFTHMRK